LYGKYLRGKRGWSILIRKEAKERNNRKILRGEGSDG